MSSARIVARTLTWFRRRSKWILLLLTAFVCSYIIVEREYLTQWLGGSTNNQLNNLIHQSNTNNKNIQLKSEDMNILPQSMNEICHQMIKNESHYDYDLHDLYETVVGKEGTLRKAEIRPVAQGKLKVFVLPFTHVDPGWLKTFDEYSVDTNKILNNMHSFMTKNDKMRFMWAEFVFFERWWKDQTDQVKNDIRELVKKGNLEFASGSWVMTDEANAYFPISVDNIIEGHQFLQREFGQLPSVVWSNDPFGYSNSVPYLFTQAGIKRSVINRIHHSIKQHLQKQRAIPFKWRQYFDDTSDMLTQVLPYTHYDILNSCGPNAGSCCQFDFKRITHWSCPGPKPTNITSSNVQEKSKLLIDQLRQMSSMYEAPVMLMMHGDDFRFDMIQEWHQHHDNFLPLFEEINKGDQVEISFGTFSDYFNELEKWYGNNSSPPTVTGDFFPYMCALGDYWTGYYTTRPFYKKQGRQTHHLIRTADLVVGEASNISSFDRKKAFDDLTKARRILSLFQHHDAITGTSKVHVMKDYSKLLFDASNIAKSVIEDATRAIGEDDQKIKVIEYAIKVDENIVKTLLNIQSNNEIHVSIYNSLPYIRHTVISLLVTSEKCIVKEDGEEIEAQIEPTLYNERLRGEGVLLSFRVTLPPLSSRIYSIHHSSSPSKTFISKLSAPSNLIDTIQKQIPSFFIVTPENNSIVTLSTPNLSSIHDTKSGLLKKISSKTIGDIPIELGLSEYTKSGGGAYILRVNGVPKNLSGDDMISLFVSGPIQSTSYSISNLYQHSTTIRDLPGDLSDHIHVSIRVDLRKEKNTELVWTLSSENEDDDVSFYTDSVGLQMLKRKSYSSISKSANYYPMPTGAIVEDGKKRITILSDVEHGVMSIGKMGMEVMLDRMLNQDDGKGLGQSDDSYPTDLLPIDIHLTIVPERRDTPSESLHHTYHSLSSSIALQSLLYPPVTMTSSKGSISRTPHRSFPCDIQLLTTRMISINKMMVIIFRNGIDCSMKTTVTCIDSKITDSIQSLLSRLGATSNIHRTLLNGIEVIQTYNTVQDIDNSAIPSPQKFTSFVFDI